MPHYTRFRVLVFIILTFYQVAKCTKPTISPSEKEIVINEGDPLKITCSGSTQIKAIYPDAFGDLVNTSVPRISVNEENGIYKYVFERPKTVFGDTGWYGCANQDIDITPNFYDDPEVNWLYVYVKSHINLFVEADTFAPLNAVAGESAVIPCRPTSPELVPSLINNSEDELEHKTSFDPKIGFTISNLTVKDSDWFKCSIEKDDIEDTVNYVLSVHLRQALSEPKIHDDNLRHVTRGQDLQVNCTVEVDTAMRYVFNFTTPQQ